MQMIFNIIVTLTWDDTGYVQWNVLYADINLVELNSHCYFKKAKTTSILVPVIGTDFQMWKQKPVEPRVLSSKLTYIYIS